MQCDEYNSARLQILLQATSQKAFIVKAEDILLNSNKVQPYESEEMFLPQHEQDCGGLPHSVELAIGMHVMLIKNIDLSIGLVNGAIGTITVLCKSNANEFQRNSWLFEEISLETIFRRNFPTFS